MALYEILKFQGICCKIQRILAMVREVEMTCVLMSTWHNKNMEQEGDIDSQLPTFISTLVES
jgi:hypothetical protein